MKNNIIGQRKNKENFIQQYIAMMTIAFIIIFSLFIGICLSIDGQKSVSVSQNMLININTSKESKNAIQEDTEINIPQYINLGEFRLTAYCSCSICCEQYANNRPLDKDGNEIVYTASRKIAKSEYTIAADPSILPYGTIVYINGHKYEVQDCGGAIKENSIDIYFDSHEAALEFGVQYSDVFIEMN